jgi:hypothetical protein
MKETTMAVVGNEQEESRPLVLLYFDYKNGDVAKDFAGRMRIADHARVTLVWSMNFKSEADVLGGVAAIVIERDCAQHAMIAQCYRSFSPDTEIHYMTSDGQWDNDADEEPNQPEQSAVSAEAAPTPEAGNDTAAGSTDPEKVPVLDPDVGTVSDTADGNFDAEESATDGDTEGDSREAE